MTMNAQGGFKAIETTMNEVKEDERRARTLY